MSSNQETPNPAAAGVPIDAGPPHQAFFLVLSYLPLLELLSMSAVCVSLRDAVERDLLPWPHILVDGRLSSRLSDKILKRIVRKADGRLRTLALIKCFKISDSGLHKVVARNPLLCKLYVPGCTRLTPEGVVRAVKTLSQHSHNLKSIMIGGIYNIENEHLEVLQYHLHINRSQQQQQQRLLCHEYIDRSKLLSDEYQPMIDVQICPKCNEILRVYDCSRESCKIKQEDKLQADCRACTGCIKRCEECGGCVDEADYEVEEAVCACSLCTSCWLRLPKCNHCNKPYCLRRNRCDEPYCMLHSPLVRNSAPGFVCEVCLEM
ncbi:F-box protein SKIP28 [Momordica charantia]|uniref:F-box protein SKIP28 n=1 Tax=Momordica charantia TaxID=3673 RepID=A0A6J1CZ11_MOMCH|nr:F-box protein SKIP28 [Momordica charantia]